MTERGWPRLLILSFDRSAVSVVSGSEREQALKHNSPDHLETYVPESEVSALRAEWDDELEELISWPSCPSGRPEASAWIEGRDAAVRAFIQALGKTK